MSKTLKERYASSPLFGSNATAVEALYEQFLQKPDTVPEAWRDYFETLGDPDTEIAHSPIRDSLLDQATSDGRARTLRRNRPPYHA